MMVTFRAPAADRIDPPASVRLHRPVVAIVGVIVVVTLVSLLLTHSLSYDAESWVVWAREITGGRRLMTWDGPTWKPLPALVIAPFTWISRGEADVYYWQAIVRVGALLGVAGVFAVTRRAGGMAAAMLAGLLVLVSSWWFYFALLGTAESLMVPLSAGAVLAQQHATRAEAADATAGARNWTALAAFLAWLDCLIRPEVVPFALLYAAWLLWQRRRRVRALLIATAWAAAGVASVAIAWEVPGLFRTGPSTLSTATGNAPVVTDAVHARIPFLAVFQQIYSTSGVTVIPALLVLAGLVIIVAEAWRAGRVGGLRGVTAAWTPTWGIGVASLGYVLVVAVMTQAGFAGNPRYLIPALAGLDGFAALTALRLLRMVVERVSRGRADRPAPHAAAATSRSTAATAVTVIVITAAAFVFAYSTTHARFVYVNARTQLENLVRTQVAQYPCEGRVRTYANTNSTLSLYTGNSMAATMPPKHARTHPHRFVYCERAAG